MPDPGRDGESEGEDIPPRNTHNGNDNGRSRVEKKRKKKIEKISGEQIS